ncbi:putative ribonuclease H-like domain-containing protein [Tanacetum coccineum]
MVKDKDALQQIFNSWSASSKNLWKLIDCGMSSTVKIGLGYGIKSNAEVLGYEEEISRGIFAFRETNAGYNDIPLYSRFKQVEYKGVPHPLSGDYTPREQEDIDDSLYEYGKYGPQPQSPSPIESDASSTVSSTCQSNDSDGEQGTVSDHSVNDDPIPLPLMAGIAAFRSTRVVHAMLGKLHQQWTNSNRVNKAKSISLPVLSAGTHLSLGLLDLITGKGQHVYFLGKVGTAVKTSAGCVWRKTTPLSNTNSGPTPDSNVNVSRGPQGRPKPVKAWGPHLKIIKKGSKVGSVTFGGSKRCISGKAKCTFTEKECFVVSSDFKMPDENQQKASSNEAKSEAQEFRRVKQPQGSVKAKELDRDKGYKQEFSIARILSKIGVAERSISTLIEDAGTMLADSHLPYTFWAEAFNTACYTFNRRWMFDLDYLTDSKNYILVSVQNQANPAGSKEVIDIDVQTEEAAELMVITSTSLTEATRKAAVSEEIATKKTHPKLPSSYPYPIAEQQSANRTYPKEVFSDADDDEMPEIRIYDKSSEGIFEKASYDDEGIISDFNNLPDEVDVPTNPTLRIHNAHPQSQILGDPNTPVRLEALSRKSLRLML